MVSHKDLPGEGDSRRSTPNGEGVRKDNWDMRTVINYVGATSLALLGMFGTAQAQLCPPGQNCDPQAAEVTSVPLGPNQLGAPFQSAFFTRFDSMGGTRKLQSVTIMSSVAASYTASLENLLTSGPADVSLTALVAVQLEDETNVSGGPGDHVIDLDPLSAGNTLGFNQVLNIGPVTLAAFDGNANGQGPSGFTQADTINLNGAVVLTDAMDLARFTVGSGVGPAGGVFIRYSTAPPMPQCTSASDVDCDFLSSATATITIRYNYCLCVETPDCKCLNRREPGSLLLFPEYNKGPGRLTVFTVTNANCDFFDGNVDVEFRYINGDSCLESNQKESLTPCDTITFLTNSHSNNNKGYAYAYARNSSITSAVNPAGVPIVFNHLVGQLIVVDGWSSIEYSMNAVSFKGVGEEGSSTDRENPGPVPGTIGDGIRDLDNFEYEEAPDKVYIPRFLGQDPVLNPRGLHSDLILIALSGGRLFEANQITPGGGTTVLIHGWNDNEEMFSIEHTFDCWQKIRLGLVQSGDVITPVPGTLAFDQSTIGGLLDDPSEIAGWNGRDAGWFWVDGLAASSSAETIDDPAIYAVLVETVRSRSAADLPFEYCTQPNGDLLPGSILGDFNRLATPPLNSMDNQ